MTRTERLGPVVEHVDKKEQEGLQALAESQDQVSIEQNKLAQLHAYRLEYFNKHDHTEISYSVIQLQEFNRFLAQLDDTIKKQMDVIKIKEVELAQKRESWLELRTNSRAMHKVVENIQQEEHIRQTRSEQKAMDEFSQRRSRTRR